MTSDRKNMDPSNDPYYTAVIQSFGMMIPQVP